MNKIKFTKLAFTMAFSTMGISTSVANHYEPVITRKLVVKCEGNFWISEGGTYGGGTNTGNAVIKIFRNKSSNEFHPWYSALINTKGDPSNPGVVVKDYVFPSLRRAYFPDYPEASSFSWMSGPGDARQGSFSLSITKALSASESATTYSYPYTAEHTFSPNISCQWAEGEGHRIFRPEDYVE